MFVPRRRTTLAVVLAASISLPAGADAQYDTPPPPAAYALEGVTVVRADGSRQEEVTVVVRGPMLETAAPGAAVPADARVLEGENLRVYPGLVDAWGRAPVSLPQPPDPEEVTEWEPSRAAQGFTPRLRIADHLTATGPDLRERRREGIVASGVFPTRGFASGLGAALLHRPEAETPRELVARPEVGLALSFQGAADAYPSTLFGVIAELRQRFTDAQHLIGLEREYGQNPTGMTLPPWDPDSEVLRRVAGAGLPAFFSASGAEDIRRVLGLASELGFSPVVVGGGEAWEVTDVLAELEIPVLVSLDFPEPRHWDPDEEPDTAAAGAAPDTLDAAAARERERLVNLYSNPARLAEAGVVFALTSGHGEADLREGARRAMEYGLSEEDALAALTATPARLLGIEPVSRIVPGWAANFVVTDGPLFEEETRVLYTFVEGRLEEPEEDEESEDEEEAGENAGGSSR